MANLTYVHICLKYMYTPQFTKLKCADVYLCVCMKSKSFKFFEYSLCLKLWVSQHIEVSVWAHLLGKSQQDVQIPEWSLCTNLAEVLLC